MPAPDSKVEPGARERRFTRHHARRRLGLAPAGLVVLHCGPMAPRSNIDAIILGLALLLRRHGIGAALLAVDDAPVDSADAGAGAERARLRQLARELGIEQQVHFMAGDSGGDCLAASDVLVGMPWRAREHRSGPASTGWIRPAPEPDAGIPTSEVVDGVTGWLIPPRDAQALADHLARLQRQFGLAPAIGAACLSRVPA